jgi:hypothetical protein
MQVSQATHSHTIHSEFNAISSYLFPLISCPALVPVDQNHIGHRGKGHITLNTLQGSAGPLQRISPHQCLTLTTLGLPTWSRHPDWISVSLHQSEGLVCDSTASFSHPEGDPWITSGVRTPGSRDPTPGRLQSWGVRTHYPTGLSGLISLGPSENVAGTITDEQEWDSNPADWKKGRFIYASGSAPGSLQNSASPLAQGC